MSAQNKTTKPSAKNFWGDILSGADKLTGFKWDKDDIIKSSKKDTYSCFKLNLAGHPAGSGLHASHSFDLIKNVDNSLKVEQKTTFEHDFTNNTVLKVEHGKDGHVFNVECNPESLNKDGQHVTSDVEFTCDPKEQNWECKGSLAWGGKDFGGVTPWVHVEASTDKKNSKEVVASANFNYKDFHIAGEATHDTKDLKQAYGIFSLTNDHGQFWLKSNILEKIMTAGFMCSCNKVAAEASYDISGKRKGFQGFPLFFRLGFTKTWSNGFKSTSAIFGGETLNFKETWINPIDKNIKVGLCFEGDMSKVLFNTGSSGFRFGTTLSFSQ